MGAFFSVMAPDYSTGELREQLKSLPAEKVFDIFYQVLEDTPFLQREDQFFRLLKIDKRSRSILLGYMKHTPSLMEIIPIVIPSDRTDIDLDIHKMARWVIVIGSEIGALQPREKEELYRYHNLTKLTIDAITLDFDFSQFPNLRTLSLMDETNISKLIEIKKLEHLELGYSGSGFVLESFSLPRNLKTVKITGDDLWQLNFQDLPNLEELSLTECIFVSDYETTLQSLIHLKNFKRLSLIDVWNYDDEGEKRHIKFESFLPGLKNLSFLRLEGFNDGSGDLVNLSSLEGLSKLLTLEVHRSNIASLGSLEKLSLDTLILRKDLILDIRLGLSSTVEEIGEILRRLHKKIRYFEEVESRIRIIDD